MSDYRRMRTLNHNVSTGVSINTTGGTTTLATANGSAKQTIFLQKVHIEITTGSSGVTWSVQGDATGANLIPNVSAAAIAHFDFDFGPSGVPCTQGKNLVLVPSATGAAGSINTEAYERGTSVMTYAQASI